MKKTFALFTVLVFLASSVSGALVFNSAKGAVIFSEYLSLPAITINQDGTVTPENANITRNGDTYYLTSDLIKQYNIVINRSNVVFDGGEFFIDVTIEGIIREGNDLFAYLNDGITLDGVYNVTVRNVKIYSNGPSIKANNCTYEKVTATGAKINILGDFNVITNCTCGVDIIDGSNNIITRNTINDFFVLRYNKSNMFYQNNIYLKPNVTFNELFYYDGASASWDNGIIGNYWSDYLTKYPNASEINSTGIWNKPYSFSRYNNVDKHPLMYPIGAPQINATCTENATYTDSFPLNFTVNKPIKSACYSLDGAGNVTVSSNTTLSGIPAGVHNITVYATDIYGFEGTSNTVTFTITAQTAAPEQSLTVAVTVAIGILAVVAVLCLAFLKKKR